jgi:hypothetical protein
MGDVTGAIPLALAAGAFLGNDLAPDVAVANSAEDSITLYRGDSVIMNPYGYSTWFSTAPVFTGPTPVGVAVADLVGDSNQDLAVITSGDNSLRIYAGNGDGFPGMVDTYTLDIIVPMALEAADVNGDGLTDLVVLNGDGTVVTYKNMGAALPFQSSGAVALGGTATAMALGDYSGDMVADLAVTISSPVPQVELRVASPVTGAFVIVGPTLATDPNPASVAFGDYSGDGRADIAVGHVPGTQVATFRNIDGTSFDAPELLVVGSDVPALGLRDLNSDNRADLLLATDSSQSLTIYERGVTSWWYYQSILNWTGVKDLAVADLNADGRPDVLTADSIDYAMSTFMGRGPLPAALDSQFSLVAPADAKIAYVYRGAFLETYDWKMTAPATGGAMTFVFPPPSTLAPARLRPSGQRAQWDPNFDLYDTGAPFNYHDSRTHNGYYGYTGTQTYGYIRQ